MLVALVGFALTALIGTRLADRPGVYWASQRVGILAPKSAENPNTLQLSLRSINMTAGMVAQLVSEDHRVSRPVEPEMPLANVGITSGWSVEQPDRGGQWSHQYSDPYVTIQVVDPDPERVEQQMAALEKKVRATIAAIQEESDVAPVNRFTTTTSPPTINVFHQAGSPSRALAGTALLGGGATLFLAYGTFVLARRRMSRTS
ncbi:hypothetical protein [Nocardioides sp. P5_E3]